MSGRERAREPAGGDAGEADSPRDFIREIVRADVAAGRNGGRVMTRWPPEPNGFMHVGHVKAVRLNFDIAREHGGVFNLRFDDTNPTAEEQRFVDAIRDDVRWLGCDWGENLYYASDYFDQLYEFACRLVRRGRAFVCELDAEQMREYRGTLTEPGRPSPWRDRSADENLDLFERMHAGGFQDGTRVLRAKIDMASPNINMRDPVLYRIQRASHYRTGNAWVIYPTYDFQHCLSDAIEGVTHSLCTLEFEDHRPLYDWILDAVGTDCHPQQIEFAKFALSYTVLGKRHLRRLVTEHHVSGWDDPRMPTVAGMRRRGYPAEAITACIESVGVAKRKNTIGLAQLEHAVRDDLNRTAPRAMGVLDPLRVVIENYPEDATEEVEAVNNPEDPGMGTRRLPFSRVLYIERDDFREDPPRKYFRLAPGREVRLRYAYFVTCVDVVKDEAGQPIELRCTYDPATRGGDAPDRRRVKGTLHWVSAAHARRVRVRLYDRLFSVPDPMDVPEGGDFIDHLNPTSLEEREDCWIEPALADAPHGHRLQLERLGYFSVDPDSEPGRPVLNRIVPLRDSWAKLEKKLSSG